MSTTRPSDAIARIEAALSRIEARGRGRPDTAELDALQVRHRGLRDSVEHTIAEIDRLIAAAAPR